jgi:predicted Ser/Thr protein kinase
MLETTSTDTRTPRAYAAGGTPPPSFTRADVERAEKRLIRRGRWPKAELWRVQISGDEWVVKDFRPRDLVTRNTIGLWLLGREWRALSRVAGVPGTPPDAFRIDRHALAYRFITGRPLAKVPFREQPKEYFEKLEGLLDAVHARGVVHLDNRNCNNILMTDRGEPALVDFESNIATAHLPHGVGDWLRSFDRAGVYKHWARANRGSMGAEREAALDRMNRWRKVWVLRGIWFVPRELKKAWRRLRGKPAK